MTGVERHRGGAAGGGDRDRDRRPVPALVAILKLGWLASFLSRAVVTGFLAGAAIDVVIGELPKLTGTVRRTA